MANWDPSYPNEEVHWYDEYIARNAPISTSWMQQPRNRESAEHEYLEARGMAVYRPPGEADATLIVAPLDDGSLCLWDINGTRGRKGAIVGRSKSGILSVDKNPQPEDGRRSKMISTGVTECISIDSAQNRAYVAVQSGKTASPQLRSHNFPALVPSKVSDELVASITIDYPTPSLAPKALPDPTFAGSADRSTGLVEVDLETLSTINHERFPFSITALSEAKHPVPLTVGTNLSLYLHDPRKRSSTAQNSSDIERLDSYDVQFGSLRNQRSLSFRSMLNPEPSPDYAHLYQPGPLSILHLPTSGDEWDGNGDIYVAGRFPSILNYDRRFFPRLRGTIHSGARLCSMASLSYPFASMEKDLARRGELSMEQIIEFKNRPGKTLIACGEYNSKGSLEMYGLSPNPLDTVMSTDFAAGSLQNSVMKNRQTSSSSKLLSVSNHGTRIVVSDGGGNLKWLERDGFTEARRWNVAHGSVEAPRGIFGTLGDSYMDSGSGDIVLKLTSCMSGQGDRPVNDGDLALWTGEKIGLLSFSSKPGFKPEDFEETSKTAEEAHREREERVYAKTSKQFSALFLTPLQAIHAPYSRL
jgi:hypothetical protein